MNFFSLKRNVTRLFLTLTGLLFLVSAQASATNIAPSEDQLTPLLNGHQIPATMLKDIDGKSVNLAELVQKKPTVFFFYRGGWCPFCNSQMGQLKAIEPKLIDMGFQLVGISPDTPEKLKASMNDNEISYTLLSDANLQAAQDFGIAFYTSEKVTQRYMSKLNLDNPLWTTPTGDKRLVLPIPAIYIADTKGLIQFQYLNPNFRVRAAPELIITAASLVK